MKHKSFEVTFELKGLDSASAYYEFEAYASTFHNVDNSGDVVQPGAFTESLKKRKPSLLYMHQMDMPVGVVDTIYEDAKGLWVKGRLPKNDAFVRDRLHPQIEIGGISSMSIGYILRDSELAGDMLKLVAIDLYEVSFVTIPDNPQATLESFKSMGEALAAASDFKAVEAVLTSVEGISRKDSKAIISEVKRVEKQQSAKTQTKGETERDAQAKSDTDLASVFKKHIEELNA